MASKTVAVRKLARPPPRKEKPAQAASLDDMVTALLERPEINTDMRDRAERLLNMHRQQQYAADLVAAQEAMRPIFQDQYNDQTKSKYALSAARSGDPADLDADDHRRDGGRVLRDE